MRARRKNDIIIRVHYLKGGPKMGKKIVLTGGGTAGHVTPNLALIDDLQKSGYEVHYIGTENGIERSLVHGIEYHSIVAGKLRRYLSAENIKDFFRIFKGYKQAKKILMDIKPSLVFAKGGFVSVPVVYAAAKLNIPVVLHESDFSPGLANRLCMKKAEKICLSFDTATAHQDKAILTGSPIRAELHNGKRAEGLHFLQFDESKPVLLIMGGSLGAHALNNVVDSNIDAITEQFQIVHLRGRGNLNSSLETKVGYRQFEYLDQEIADIFAATDVALSRAGANALFEFLDLGIPSLLIPLPLSASRGDQIENAAYFKKHGYSLVLPQEDITPDQLLASLTELKDRREELKTNMRHSRTQGGTENVLKVIYESVREWN